MRYFIADLHLGHEKVAGIRWPNLINTGFNIDLITHHDAEIIDQMHMQLTSKDQLWVLGDVTGGASTAETRALYFLDAVKKATGAQLHLIAGNHDSVSSIHRNAWKNQKKFLEVFDSVQQFARLSFAGTNVLLSHFPYENLGDGLHRDGARYLEYRLPHKNIPLIHGHTHQLTAHTEDPYQFCVSWDVYRNLVPDTEIEKWLKDLKELQETQNNAAQ